jgi:hypothetical protein
MEKILPVLISIILFSHLISAQKLKAPIAGPSLANTMEWISVNVINVDLKNSGQFRQSFTYDFENQCQCRFLVKSLDSLNNLLTKEYTLNFADIDPENITTIDQMDFSAISLQTHKNKRKIVFLSNNIESTDDTFIIYDQYFENALRLSKALKHVAKLCQH